MGGISDDADESTWLYFSPQTPHYTANRTRVTSPVQGALEPIHRTARSLFMVSERLSTGYLKSSMQENNRKE